MTSAKASTISMTDIPELPVEEGSVVEYVCVTDYAYCSEPPSVMWLVGGESVNASDIKTVVHRGNITKSTVTLLIQRKLNSKQVKCILKNDDTKWNEHNLNVTCKYIFVITKLRVEGYSLSN